MTLARRRIDVTLQLGSGTFGENVGDTVTLTGLRVGAYVASVGGEAQGTCQCRIFGLPLSLINQFTTIGPVGWEIRGKNAIQIAAGIDGEALSVVFQGTILNAWGELSQQPDGALSIFGTSAAVAALKPAQATSFKGTVDVATVMAQFAQTMGFTFENNGVSVILSNPYFSGSTLDQVKAAARAAHIAYSTDNGVLAIWPRNGARQGNVPVLAPGAGLVSYPTFNEAYLSARATFTPSANLGGQFQITNSSISLANGLWNIVSVNHSLESQTPNGQWFTDLQGYSANGN
jgi:hypothetical protein